MAKKLHVQQIRSAINRPKGQKQTLRALGLRRLGQYVEHTATPAVIGMLAKVSHLVDVKEK